MTNGYIVLTKGDAKLYQHAVEAINLGKPIYYVDAENKAIYFGTKIALDDADVVIDAGKYTVTIESDNDVTVKTSLDMSIIEDLDGNKRFIEGELTTNVIEGVSFIYSKWSLSGTHLMIVLIGEIENGTTVTGQLAAVDLPDWVKNKIIPTTNILVDYKNVQIFDPELVDYQNMAFNLTKQTNNINIRCNSITANKQRIFRIQFDLLIESE